MTITTETEAEVTDSTFDAISSPPLEKPQEIADAHRATLTSVEAVRFDSGTVGIKLGLTSTDMAFDTFYTIFPPAEFVNNFETVFNDPTTLSDVPPEGKKQSPKVRYASVISNSAGDAEVQQLIGFAKEQSRTFEGTRPTSFGEYVSSLAALLSGIEIIFTRQPDNNAENPEYRGRLRVNRLHSISKQNNPKALKGYVKRWEA